MQIQPSYAASAAAGNVSQATSKDRSSGATSEAAHLAPAAHVERVARAEQSSADRDAQGGGQGLGPHDRPKTPEQSATATDFVADELADELSAHSAEPPGELDIIG